MPDRRATSHRRHSRVAALAAAALVCLIVGGALGAATASPTTTPSFQAPVTPLLAATPASRTRTTPPRSTGTASHGMPRYRLGGRYAVTGTPVPTRPTAIPTRLAASYHGAIPTPRPTIAPRAREPMSPTALKTAVANSAGKGR